jgi:HSP20 family molecular chaperone IbpA
MARSIRFTRIVSLADQLAAQLQGLHFASLQPTDVNWQPAVNVYAYTDRFEVCVDLAGVRKQDIKVDVEPCQLVVRGHRKMPERDCESPPCGRILVMEIADGAFERVIEFPVDVDTGRVEARQADGWLWISLPVAERGVGP